MVKIVTQEERLFLGFSYEGMDCLEPTGLAATAGNDVVAHRLAASMEQQLAAGTFRYDLAFPGSPLGRMLALPSNAAAPTVPPTRARFGSYAEQWFRERRVEWRRSYAATIRLTLDKYLLPRFGMDCVDAIDKTAILAFRTSLATAPGLAAGTTLTAARINKILQPLRMILDDAADRFDFASPWRRIRSIRLPRAQVDPLSLTEVEAFLAAVRPDFRDYFELRFFTGLRSSEINGLRWSDIDVDVGLIHVRQALVNGEFVACKNDAAHRTIAAGRRVGAALRRLATCRGEASALVFVGRRGRPLNNAWLTTHLWYPALERAGLTRRRPYQSRHTAATLWLAAGENPAWIARQLGHTTTELLFRVYARYVPNALRRDGEAIDAHLGAAPRRDAGRTRKLSARSA